MVKGSRVYKCEEEEERVSGEYNVSRKGAEQYHDKLDKKVVTNPG